jgi:hypothetical protein
LDPNFTGRSAKEDASPDLSDLFKGCDPEVKLESGKVGKRLHERATWERQVHSSAAAP